MDPSVLDLFEQDNTLRFTISNINVSYANAIRRVILTDIPTVIFRTFPYDKNTATFEINTSRLNNEILKQRLSCIPIHIEDLEMPLKDYIMEVDIKNDTETLIYVTTADFKIKNIETDKYLSNEILSDIFPPDSITKQFIDLCRLRPKISDNLPGEHLKMSCLFSIGSASESGTFNVVSTCSYHNTPDPIKRDAAREELLIELKEKYADNEAELKYQLQDWDNLDAKRIVVLDSFNFIIESVGVFKNITIVTTAINIIIKRLRNIINIYSQANNLIINSESTISNAFDILLENEDYTIGKILEYTLYETFYNGNKTLTYCGFRKPHPHISQSVIRVAFNNIVDKNTVIEYLNTAATLAIKYYEKLLPQFGETFAEDILALKPSVVTPIATPSLAATQIIRPKKHTTSKSTKSGVIPVEKTTQKSAISQQKEIVSAEDIGEVEEPEELPELDEEEVPLAIPGTAEEVELEETP